MLRPVDVRKTFNEAGAGFARWTPLLWDPVGAASAAPASLRPGDRVLDACCGAGASAIPAARAVAPGGHVDGVDLSDGLLDLARSRAAAEGLDAVTFHRADVTTWDGGPYDAVVCVFGVFFFPDMDAGTAGLLAPLRPGGRFVATTWEKGSTEPLMVPVAHAVAAETGVALQPNRSRVAADVVGSAEGLAAWLASVGVADAAVERFALDVPITPDLAWDLVVGSAGRAMLSGLDAEAVARVRADYEERLETDVFEVRALIGAGVIA
jgi:SAM-dependent methyltransferase